MKFFLPALFAVSELLLSKVNSKSYLYESFPIEFTDRGSFWDRWHSVGSPQFYFSQGNEAVEFDEYGLYADIGSGSEYATSTILPQTISEEAISQNTISLQFDVTQENYQECGDAQVYLYSHNKVEDENPFFDPKLLSYEQQDYLLRFGTRHCMSLGLFEIVFNSKKDGK